ncbi:hypothetical protein [Pseudalkalibacillus caeni]|nr:hypothetical protein [Pseudalkalibacillus caeni]
MDKSPEQIRQIEEKAKRDQQKADKARQVVEKAKRVSHPQREHGEFSDES